MVLTAVLMFSKLDLRFQTALAADLPGFLRNPTRERALRRRRGPSGARARALAVRLPRDGGAASAGRPRRSPGLAVLGSAPSSPTPALVQLGSADDRRAAGPRRARRLLDLHLHQLRRHVAVSARLDERYRRAGLTIVGVHTPEFAFEKSASNVQDAIRERGLRYPVVQDNEFGTWNAFGNQLCRPIPDRRRRARALHALRRGRLRQDRGGDPRAARRGGRRELGGTARTRGELLTPGRDATAETYLGVARARSFSPVSPRRGTTTTSSPARRRCRGVSSRSAGAGRSTTKRPRAVRRATLRARLVAKGVFLVLASKATDRAASTCRSTAGRSAPPSRPRRPRRRADRPPPAPLPPRATAAYRGACSDAALDRDVSGYAFTFR